MAIAALLIAYLGTCFNYAERLSRVERNELEQAATYVASIHEEVTFQTADGLTLKGWWFPAAAAQDRAAVIVHGKDQNRLNVFDSGRLARVLLERGYSDPTVRSPRSRRERRAALGSRRERGAGCSRGGGPGR